MKTKKELSKINEKILNTFNKVEEVEDILSQEDKERLKKIKQTLKTWQEKLADERYTIAIIGLEKAGKSTFANALLKKNFLPEDELRCTFSTAKIESSNENYAEVKFYSREEFIQKYKQLSYEIGFDKEFDNVTLQDFEEFISNQSSAIATSHEADEIRDILENKNEIEQYLTGEIKVFKDNIDSIKEYIKDPIKARAINSITIKSNQFQGDKNLVIYDVPGFDSPTKLHLEQASKYMVNSDIVIMLVSIADRVSFVKSQVDFLNSTKDKYGQNLSTKIITIATKFDYHVNDFENKMKKFFYNGLINELKKYGIYNEKNIFLASPLGYLEKHKIVNSNIALPNLEKLQMNDGIEEVKNRIREMMNGEILQLINDNFEVDISEAYKFLAEFKKNYNPSLNEKKKREEELSLIDNKWKTVSSNLKKELKILQREINNINYNLDEHISKQISEIWINELIEKVDEFIEEEEKNIVDGRVDIQQPQKINDRVRERIYKQSLEKIVKISTSIINIENEKEYNKLFEIIKKVIYENGDTLNAEELKKTINKIITKFSYDAKSYKPLILRFLNSVFEILILNSISNDEKSERANRFKKLRPDIESLLQYDENYDDSYSTFKQDFIQMLLVQKAEFKNEQIEFLSKLLQKAKVATSYEEVKEEIITDLKNLESIFNNILLKAIKIENPFKDSLKDQIQAILNDLDEFNNSEIRKFIIRNIDNIARVEYMRLYNDEKIMKKLEFIVNGIENLH